LEYVTAECFRTIDRSCFKCNCHIDLGEPALFSGRGLLRSAARAWLGNIAPAFKQLNQAA
jgi:hypothetical protein